MLSFKEALDQGFTVNSPGVFSFKFGSNNEYKLNFERLLFDNQYYVALYKNQSLLTDKVVVKPGKE